MAAEDDGEYLRSCFVDLPVVQQLKDIGARQNIILGRTGSGKTAVLRHLEWSCPNVSRIVPKDASFAFVANSTIIRYLTDLGVELHVFYEYLWKHILCIHIIRECLGIKTEEHFSTLITKFRNIVTFDQRKKSC